MGSMVNNLLNGELVLRADTGPEYHVQCSWLPQSTVIDGIVDPCFGVFEVLFQGHAQTKTLNISCETNRSLWLIPSLQPNDEVQLTARCLGGKAKLDFLFEALGHVIRSGTSRTLYFFVPLVKGHHARSDLLNIRFTDCPAVSSVMSFENDSGSEAEIPTATDSIQLLPKYISAAISSMVLQDSATSAQVQQEITNRLSFNFMRAGKQPRRLLALVEAGKNPATGLGIFNAAKSLNIGIVALDKPGHWLQGPEYAHWREAFIPVDRTPDSGFPQRVVEAIRSYGKQIDGITTFFDPLFPGVAAAAIELGLPTAPIEAYHVATDKYRTSAFEKHAAERVSSFEQATTAIQTPQSGLKYPMVVKPCSGWGSEGVFCVQSEAELKSAVSSIDTDRHGRDFVIENYCNGPEVDANFILCDGELLFFEASDDFPKDADTAATPGTALQSFIEVANVLPSALPSSEQNVLRDSLHQSLVRLGFKSGFFHLEARVQDSTMEYRKVDGVMDLCPRLEQASGPTCDKPSAWLIEINARPPGLQASWASRATYGIDFWGVAMAFSLGDTGLGRVLSIPFQTGHQYWCEIVFLPVPRGGTFDSDDVCAEMLARRPDLASHVSRSLCFFRRGDKVPDPASGILTWAGYYLVFSRESRSHLLKLADTVRAETKFVIR